MPDKKAEKKEVVETCAYCQQEFTVSRYGWNIPCPHCKKLLTVLPDPIVFFYVHGTPIGVAVVGEGKEALLELASKFSPKIWKLAKLFF